MAICQQRSCVAWCRVESKIVTNAKRGAVENEMPEVVVSMSREHRCMRKISFDTQRAETMIRIRQHA